MRLFFYKLRVKIFDEKPNPLTFVFDFSTGLVEEVETLYA
jgi:hypothetical protein